MIRDNKPPIDGKPPVDLVAKALEDLAARVANIETHLSTQTSFAAPDPYGPVVPVARVDDGDDS